MRKTLLLSSFALALIAADWPQWRGATRDGHSKDTGLLKQWPAGGPKLVWKAQGLGEGYAGLSILQGRIYTQGQRGQQELVMALDEATGKLLWETPSGKPFEESRGNGPRGTPTTDVDKLYAMAADGGLVCLERTTGKKVWGYNVVDKFGGSVPNWGYSESPLVDGDKLIVTPGGRGAAVVALNKRTGEAIWKSQNDRAGYSSAIAFDLGGQRQYAVLTGEAALGLAANTGELLWRYNKIANRTANIATPIYRDGHVFFSTDYGTGCALLKLGPKSAGEVYFNKDMRNHYSTSVLVGDHIYGFSSSVLTAMKWSTGEVAWRDRSVGKGTVAVHAEGLLYVLGENGTMALVEASPAGYKEISRFSISKGDLPTWTPPVIANGRLYLRDQDTLYCFNIKQ